MARGSKKRIAKNTLMLYCRMILTLGVSLYTSRVVLNALGVEDYGVYNVVGGVVTMLGFFNSSIGTSTQRFLNVCMEDPSDGSLRQIFSTAVNVHAIIGIATVLLLETIGLWFVTNKLVIPDDQYTAALWVYQCSVLSFFVSIISTPYNAAIIAYERMSVFAAFSIIEVLLKLGVAFAIKYYDGQRLILYAILILATTVLMRFLYSGYCSRVFKEIKYKFEVKLMLIKKMLSFSGWMIFGCLTDLLSTQGVNMMINIFFGPVFNAARSIAVQVQGAIAQFSNSFIMAVNPQIVKSYAADDKEYAYKLVFSASKLSFFLMLCLIIPITLRSYDILKLWLGIVPEYTPIFVDLILLEYLLRSSYTPIAQINQASGNIRLYQLSISLLFLANFIGSYILFKTGFPVYSTFIFSAIIAFVGLFVRIMILRYQLKFPAVQYLIKVTLPLIVIASISYFTGFCLDRIFPHTIPGMIYIIAIISIFNVILIWSLGLNKSERLFIKSKISAICVKFNHSN